MKIKLLASTLWLGTALAACSGQTPPPAPNLMILATEASEEDQVGMIDASFLPVSGAENCEERVEAARAVFPAAKIVYSWHYCTYSKTSFETFGHEPVPTGQAYYFGLEFSKDGNTLKSVTAYDNNAACKQAQKGVCILSYQDIAE